MTMSAEFGPRHGAAPVLVLDLTVTLFSVKLEGLQDLQTSLISTARRFTRRSTGALSATAASCHPASSLVSSIRTTYLIGRTLYHMAI